MLSNCNLQNLHIYYSFLENKAKRWLNFNAYWALASVTLYKFSVRTLQKVTLRYVNCLISCIQHNLDCGGRVFVLNHVFCHSCSV